MKSRELNTIHDLIVTDYKIEPIGGGKFRHFFHPKTTEKIYEFIANGAAELEEGQRYNIGYRIIDGKNIIEPSCLSKSDDVNPLLSYLHAMEFSKSRKIINKRKNDDRVNYDKTNGYHWGPKYAWREYGLVIAKDAFHSYLEEINHPKIACVITNPDNLAQTTNTEAYADEGLENAIALLIQSAEKVSKIHYKSPHYSRRFTIRGIEAITDKK